MNYLNYNESDIQTFEYETTIIVDDNICGNCNLDTAEIQMLNNSNEYSSYKKNWIKTQHGSFYIYDVKPVQEKVNIKLLCYDIKYKLETKYDKSLYTDLFPCTIAEWRNKIASNCEITFNDNDDFPNADYILNEHPYIDDGVSNRNVMMIIAQACMSNVITDKDDLFYFSWFSNIVHTANDWTELTTEKEYSNAVNVMVLGRGDVEDIVKYPTTLPDNPVEFRIDNNYILDPQDTTSENDRRYEIIESLYNRINGFSYIVFDIRTQDIVNKLDIKLGEKVKYFDIWDNEFEAYIMTKKLVYLGGDLSNSNNYEIILSATSIKETSSEFKYSQDVLSNVRKIGIEVDKQNEIIQSSVKSIQDLNGAVDANGEELKSLGTIVTQVDSKVTTSITQIQEIKENGVSIIKNTMVTIDVEGIKVSTNLSAISTLITNNSFIIKNYDETLARFNNDGAFLDNLTVKTYFTAAVHREEKYQDEETGEWRSGWFYVGGEE